MNRERILSTIGLAAALSLGAPGCGRGGLLARIIPNPVPIQAIRVSQIEPYKFEYVLDDGEEARRAMEEILGDENRCALTDNEWLPYLKMALCAQLEVAGQIALTISVHPWDMDRFFVNGQGHYVVRARGTEELVASADFRVVDGSAVPIRNIGEPVTLLLEQYLVREFNQHRKRFVHKSILAVRIRIRAIAKDVYTIDNRYSATWRGHDLALGVLDSSDSTVDLHPVGCLRFESGEDGRKLIDLRSLESPLLQYDYLKKLRDSGLDQQGDRYRVIGWQFPSRCVGKPRPLSKVCYAGPDASPLWDASPGRQWQRVLSKPPIQCPSQPAEMQEAQPAEMRETLPPQPPDVPAPWGQ